MLLKYGSVDRSLQSCHVFGYVRRRMYKRHVGGPWSKSLAERGSNKPEKFCSFISLVIYLLPKGLSASLQRSIKGMKALAVAAILGSKIVIVAVSAFDLAAIKGLIKDYSAIGAHCWFLSRPVPVQPCELLGPETGAPPGRRVRTLLLLRP